MEFTVEKLQIGLALYNIPEHMWDGVINYVMHGRPTGHFLKALFSNDFKEMASRADSNNARRLYDYALFLFNYTPAGCWGQPLAYDQWIAKRGLTGIYEDAKRKMQAECDHNWQEQPGEPPVDVCNSCGLVRE